ncbi:MAG: glucosidase [Cytophagaceae bacterium]|jgi:hypothetical protein|nr:glucosidase [Cytophagaceae bacterium]
MTQNRERERVLSTPENKGWKKWGPYMTDRQWGTVREDYSKDGSAWDFTPHDHARSRAYRWGEEGIGGICDNKQHLCFALSLWNGKDPILKERYFGLTGAETNHGEDCKEMYYYLDSTPTHSYMKMLYKYPQSSFPYQQLIEESRRRNRLEPEYELIDTGIFNDDKYFDVYIEYAKASEEDLLIQYTVYNRAKEAAMLHVLPTLWFRNTWAWGYDDYKPSMTADGKRCITVFNERIGNYFFYAEEDTQFLFCENETNTERLYNFPNAHAYTKDGINDFIVHNKYDAVNPNSFGTKASANIKLHIPAEGKATVKFRLSKTWIDRPFEDFDSSFQLRVQECDAFYAELQKGVRSEDHLRIQRQAYAGMMWTKQFFYFNVNQWLTGDPSQPKPPGERKYGRNSHWRHMNNENIISMPDKWEYPWYAAWDLAFHTLPIARLDPHFAKRQLEILLREYYMHPNGQIPAYEWNFGDVNPPVHAWGTLKVYEIDKQMNGKGDLAFLEKIFHKLLLNFTWWVNQKDSGGNNIFEGGFLGLDNIGVFDRSRPLPTGGTIEQADGTSWMAMYSLNMLKIALELSPGNPVYQDMASKFFEHFLHIAGALFNVSGEGVDLWDDEDKFFYDMLHLPNGHSVPLKVRSMVGLIPLYAVEVLSPEILDQLPVFKRRVEWVLSNRPDLANLISRWNEHGKGEKRLLSILRGHRMKRLLSRMLDETEFLSDYGIRALSKFHKNHPYEFHVNGEVFRVNYNPGESDSGLFGGNSNWRGPIWMPVNFLLIDSMEKFHDYYGEEFKIEFPTGSGNMVNLREAAKQVGLRLLRIFERDAKGHRAFNGSYAKLQDDPHFKDHILYYEYFHGDNGMGIGASHQTGWTGLIAELITDFCQEK